MEYEFEDVAAEDLGYDDFPEDIDYGYTEDMGDDDYEGASESRSYRMSAINQARARARAQAMAQARRGMPGFQAFPMPYTRPAYFPPPPTRPASTTQVRQGFTRVGTDVQKVKAGLRSIDLNTKVQSDLISRSLKAQSARITGTENAAAASAIAGQLKDLFPDLVSNPIIRSALPLAPLLFLKPVKKGTGIAAIASDPRVWSSTIVFALLGIKELLERTNPPGKQATLSGSSVSAATPQATQSDLAAQIGQLNRLTAELLQITQTLQAAQSPASPAQAPVTMPSAEVLQALVASIMAPQKEKVADSPAQAPQDPAQAPKAKNT